MSDMMTFPATFDEFAEQYKITDTEKVYTNGSELIPVFRVRQWLEHQENQTADARKLRAARRARCERCVYWRNCTRNRDLDNCPDYKRDPPDGGYYG